MNTSAQPFRSPDFLVDNQVLYQSSTQKLRALVDGIACGEIAKPDLQRPYIWQNKQVENLFESLYKGYPVGVIILWRDASARFTQISTTANENITPRLLIIDGQQRLTSVLGAATGLPILRENGIKAHIRVLFDPYPDPSNPECVKFYVTSGESANFRRTPFAITDIAAFFSQPVGEFLTSYFQKVEASGTVPRALKNMLTDKILRLRAILDRDIDIKEIHSSVPLEKVAEIFRYINIATSRLDVTDFIFSLIAVYWNEGKNRIDTFCNQSRYDMNGMSTAANKLHFIVDKKKFMQNIARYIFHKSGSIGEMDKALARQSTRESTISALRDAIMKFTSMENWHGFINGLYDQGFVSKDLLPADGCILGAYTMFLIGKYEKQIPTASLLRFVRRLIIFAGLTHRYYSSGTIEEDVALAKRSRNMIADFDTMMTTYLTNDYWDQTVVAEIANKTTRAFISHVYYAGKISAGTDIIMTKPPMKVAEYFTSRGRSCRKYMLVTRKHGKENPADSVFIPNNRNIDMTSMKKFWDDVIAQAGQREAEYLTALDLPPKFYNMGQVELLAARHTIMAKVIKSFFDR